MNKVLIGVLAVVGFIGVMFALALFSAFTITTLWGWFLIPLGAFHINMLQAYGLALMFSAFMGTRGVNHKASVTDSLGQGILFNLVLLGFGYITVSLM